MKVLIFYFSLVFSGAISAQDTIHWRSDYKLKWDDFNGIPDSSSPYKAISSSSIGYTLSYNKTSFSYKVSCTFNKKSWVKIRDSFLLSHERGHFDIAELFARKLRQLFATYKLSPQAIEIDLKFYTLIKEERDKLDNTYDIETNFSQNKQRQIYWNKKIDVEIMKLKAYAE